MSSTLDALLDEVKDDALTLMRSSSDHLVLEAVVREGAPAVIGYKTRGIIPDARTMQRLATYLIALAAAQEQSRLIRRSRREQKERDNGEKS